MVLTMGNCWFYPGQYLINNPGRYRTFAVFNNFISTDLMYFCKFIFSAPNKKVKLLVIFLIGSFFCSRLTRGAFVRPKKHDLLCKSNFNFYKLEISDKFIVNQCTTKTPVARNTFFFYGIDWKQSIVQILNVAAAGCNFSHSTKCWFEFWFIVRY